MRKRHSWKSKRILIIDMDVLLVWGVFIMENRLCKIVACDIEFEMIMSYNKLSYLC